jgi:Cu(I)/Ag(I) efflux system periplasmic protein CusF
MRLRNRHDWLSVVPPWIQEQFVNTPLMQIRRQSLRALMAGAGMALSLTVMAQQVDGEVVKIDQDAVKITLKHEAIKKLDMPAMPRMSYRVSNPEWLKTLQVGDKVKFSADKVNDQYTVTAIEKKAP